MAHPEELAPSIPDTLPEDFSEWDGEASPAPLPDHSSPEAETAQRMSQTAAPRGQSSYRDAVARASAPRAQRVSGSNPPEPVFGRQRETVVESLPSRPVEYAVSDNPKQPVQSAERATVLSPRDARAVASATAIAEPQKLTGELVDESAGRAAKGSAARSAVAEERDSHEVRKSKMREADEAIAELFSMKNVEVKQEEKRSKNKWMMVAAAGACSILLSFALTILLGHHGAKAATNQPIQSFSGATEIPLKADGQKPPAGEPLVQGSQSAAAAMQPTTSNEPAQEQVATNQPPTVSESQTQMMNEQLAAPRTIQKDAEKQVAEDAPPPVSFGAADSDRGALPGVFNGHAQKVVAAPPPKPPVISSGVAIGMLVHQTPPTYPPIAKSARVSGIVQLHATIDKTGAIRDLYVMTGPQMLRQAALDAVKTWRYKPYTLNHDPIDVETTINVAFTLGN